MLETEGQQRGLPLLDITRRSATFKLVERTLAMTGRQMLRVHMAKARLQQQRTPAARACGCRLGDRSEGQQHDCQRSKDERAARHGHNCG